MQYVCREATCVTFYDKMLAMIHRVSIQWVCKRRTFRSQKTTPDDGGVAIRRLKCLTQRYVPDQ